MVFRAKKDNLKLTSIQLQTEYRHMLSSAPTREDILFQILSDGSATATDSAQGTHNYLISKPKLLNFIFDENQTPLQVEMILGELLEKTNDRPPEPLAGKNRIILSCQNLDDGRGDYEHLKNYIRLIKSIVGDQYKVTPILFVEINEDNLERANRQKAIAEEFKLFCDEERVSCIALIGHESLNDLSAYETIFEEGCAHFDIAYPSGIKFPHLERIDCYQLSYRSRDTDGGMGLPTSPYAATEPFEESRNKNPDHFKRLPPNANTSNGLLLDEYDESIEAASKAFISFKSEKGVQLLNHLLGDSVSECSAKEYLQTHKRMPGYPQTDWAAQTFILTGLLKNMNDVRELKMHCDFFLPPNIVNVSRLQGQIKELKIKFPIKIITPQGVTHSLNSSFAQEGGPEVRIFSGFFLEDEEYKNLLRYRNDIGMGSGDNTIMQTLSSSYLPLPQVKHGTIYRFLKHELAFLVEVLAHDQEFSEKQRDCLFKTSLYLHHVTDFSSQLHIEYTEAYQAQIEQAWSSIDGNKDKYLPYLQELANLANDDKVINGWKITRDYLKEHYNYKNKLPAILCGAIERSQAQLTEKSRFRP